MRTALIMEDPVPKKIERIEGVREISAVLLNFFRASVPEFIPDRSASSLCGYPTKPNGDCGWLLVSFLLSDLRREVGRAQYELDDDLLVSSLDALSGAGEIRIKTMNFQRFGPPDLYFRAILGASVQETYYPYTFPTLRSVTWLSPTKIYPKGFIEKPSVVFKSLKNAREKALERAFGSKDFELERRLIHEEILDDAKLRREIEKLAEAGSIKK